MWNKIENKLNEGLEWLFEHPGIVTVVGVCFSMCVVIAVVLSLAALMSKIDFNDICEKAREFKPVIKIEVIQENKGE